MNFDIWVKTHGVSDEMLWSGAAAVQIVTFKELAGEAERADVVSQHRSKSISLPVVLFTYSNGATAQVRDNFYDVKVTVRAPRPVALPEGVDGTEVISDCYCEGFPRGTVLGSHADNPRAFTVATAMDGLRALLAEVAKS